MPWPWRTLALTLGAAVLAYWPTATEYLALSQAEPRLWQIVTAHWVHWSLAHAGWDIATFAGLGMLAEWLDRRRFVSTLAAAMVTIALFVHALHPELRSYAGLSGIDVALFALVAGLLLRSGWRRAGWPRRLVLVFAVLAVPLKLGWELVMGTAIFVGGEAEPFRLVPTAHVVGALCGYLVAWWPTSGQRSSRRQLPARAGV